MPLVLDATPAGPTANSYATRVEADAYHETRPSRYNATWNAATSGDKEAALVWATRLLDGLISWVGIASTSAQALQWPRQFILDAHQLLYVDSGIIPDELKNATAELARQLLEGDRTAENDIDVQGITAIKAGSVAINFRSSNITVKTLPPALWGLIPSWWYSGGTRQSNIMPLARS